MSSLVLFRSEYGHAEKYAQWLGESLSTSPIDLADLRPTPLMGADCAVFVLPVYGGKLTAIKRVGQLAKEAPEVPIAIATVSMSDLNAENANRDELLAKCKKVLPKGVFERISWFHLRGGIDYDRMRFQHRMMMRMMFTMLRQRAKKGDKKAQQFRDGFGKSVDLSEQAALQPVLEFAAKCRAEAQQPDTTQQAETEQPDKPEQPDTPEQPETKAQHND